MTMSPISPVSDPESVASNDLWDKATIISGRGGHPLELDLCDPEGEEVEEMGFSDAQTADPRRRGRQNRGPSCHDDLGQHHLAMISPLSPMTPTTIMGVLGPEEPSSTHHKPQTINYHPPPRRSSLRTPLSAPFPIPTPPVVDEPTVEEEEDDDTSSSRSLSPIQYARRPDRGDQDESEDDGEREDDSPLWARSPRSWEKREGGTRPTSPLRFTQHESDDEEDLDDPFSDPQDDRRSISLDSHRPNSMRHSTPRVVTGSAASSATATPHSTPPRSHSPVAGQPAAPSAVRKPSPPFPTSDSARRNRTLSPGSKPAAVHSPAVSPLSARRAVSPKGLVLQTNGVSVGPGGMLVLRSPPANTTNFSRGRAGTGNPAPSSSRAASAGLRMAGTPPSRGTNLAMGNARERTVSGSSRKPPVLGGMRQQQAMVLPMSSSSSPSAPPSYPSTTPSQALPLPTSLVITPFVKRTHFRKSMSVDSINVPSSIIARPSATPGHVPRKPSLPNSPLSSLANSSPPTGTWSYSKLATTILIFVSQNHPQTHLLHYIHRHHLPQLYG